MLVVEDFSKVFADKLPKLFLDREIEFRIDFKPATAPTHKAPYRMGPMKLNELKV